MAVGKDYVELLPLQAVAAPAIVKSAEQDVAVYLSVTLVTWFAIDSLIAPTKGPIFQFEGNLDDTGDSNWFPLDQVQEDISPSFDQVLDNPVAPSEDTIVDSGAQSAALPLKGHTFLYGAVFGTSEWVRTGRVNEGVSVVIMDPVHYAHFLGGIWRNHAHVSVRIVPLESIKRFRVLFNNYANGATGNQPCIIRVQATFTKG